MPIPPRPRAASAPGRDAHRPSHFPRRKCKPDCSPGEALFAASRLRKASGNGADRLRKYLARFGLDGARVRGGPA